MLQPHRSLGAVAAVAAAAAGVALSFGCSNSGTAPEEHLSIAFGSKAGPTSGLVGHGTPHSLTASLNPTEPSAPTVPLPGGGAPYVYFSAIVKIVTSALRCSRDEKFSAHAGRARVKPVSVDQFQPRLWQYSFTCSR